MTRVPFQSAPVVYARHDDGPVSESLRIVCWSVLQTPNQVRGRHWRAKHFERKRWEAGLVFVFAMHGARETLEAWRAGSAAARHRVSVERRCRRRQQFIKDPDNLTFSAKPLLDAMVSVGLLYDDASRYIDLHVRQVIIPATEPSTAIFVERLRPL